MRHQLCPALSGSRMIGVVSCSSTVSLAGTAKFPRDRRVDVRTHDGDVSSYWKRLIVVGLATPLATRRPVSAHLEVVGANCAVWTPSWKLTAAKLNGDLCTAGTTLSWPDPLTLATLTPFWSEIAHSCGAAATAVPVTAIASASSAIAVDRDGGRTRRCIEIPPWMTSGADSTSAGEPDVKVPPPSAERDLAWVAGAALSPGPRPARSPRSPCPGSGRRTATWPRRRGSAPRRRRR